MGSKAAQRPNSPTLFCSTDRELHNTCRRPLIHHADEIDRSQNYAELQMFGTDRYTLDFLEMTACRSPRFSDAPDTYLLHGLMLSK